MANQSKSITYPSEQDLRKEVRAIIIELAPNPDGQSAQEARLVDDLGYHSLALLELAFALEDEFDLQPIDEATARKIIKMMDVENHVVKELKSIGRLKESAD